MKSKHDFRTPLNHIIGYCEMLLEEAADLKEPRLVADLEQIHAIGRRLVSVINDLFDPLKSAAFQSDPNLVQSEIRAPVGQIISLTDRLRAPGAREFDPDLEKILAAARQLLGLVEERFAGPLLDSGRRENPPATFTRRISVASAPARAPAGSILVVDDDEGNRDMLARRLMRLGFRVGLAEHGRRALEMLRAEEFDLIFLDINMPELDGYQVLEQLKSDAALRDVPVIVLSASDETVGVARAIELGAEDYLPKPFDPTLLQARLGATLEKKRLRDKERQTYEALVASEKRLAAELADAALYVRSLLPAPLEERVKVQWRFQPSAELGGDCFGYHWLAGGKLAVYLLDVSGHGVGAALLSVSVLNLLRAEALGGADFCDPASVLQGLNRAFPMERHNNLIFTMWYGVFDPAARRLAYASGGHPPAVLIEPGIGTLFAPRELSTKGSVLGLDPDAEFRSDSCVVPRGGRLYIFSDGAFEICGPDGRTRQLPELIQQLLGPATGGAPKLDQVVDWARAVRGQPALEDDLSIMELAL